MMVATTSLDPSAGCITSTYTITQPSTAVELVITGNASAIIPSSEASVFGLPTSCLLGLGFGIPMYNAPVLALTSTSTVLQGNFVMPITPIPEPVANPSVTELLPSSLGNIIVPTPTIVVSSNSVLPDLQPTPTTAGQPVLTVNNPGSALLSPSTATNQPSISQPPEPPVKPNVQYSAPAPTSIATDGPGPAPQSPDLPALGGTQPVTIGDSTTVFSLGGQKFTANPTGFAVAGTTLTPGGPPIIISGTPISLGSAAVVIGSSTIALPASVPTPTPAVFSVGGQIFTANPTGFAVGGTTITPGGPPLIISGSPISLAITALVIGTSTIHFSTAPSPAVITLGGSTITANSQSDFIIGSQTLVPGVSPITIAGTLVSLAPEASYLVIGSTTININPVPSPAVLTIGGSTITANSQSDFVIGTQTLIPGAPAITLSGTPISLAPSASEVVIGGSTIYLSPVASSPPAIITIDGSIFTANAQSDFIIGTQTLIPGAPAITVSGTPISLASLASDVVIGTSTIDLVHAPVITIGGSVYTENAQSDFIIGTQTLIPGAPAITVSGTPISLAPSALDVVIGTSTIDLIHAPVITIGGSVYTENAQSDFIIGTQTLIPGAPAITVAGTPVSLAPDASDVVVGTKTEGLGGLIMSGMGAATGPTGLVPSQLAGGAGETGLGLSMWRLLGLVVGIGIVMVL